LASAAIFVENSSGVIVPKKVGLRLIFSTLLTNSGWYAKPPPTDNMTALALFAAAAPSAIASGHSIFLFVTPWIASVAMVA
jgi:hypothetical protein